MSAASPIDFDFCSSPSPVVIFAGLFQNLKKSLAGVIAPPHRKACFSPKRHMRPG
jgi:hypothetical protein